MRRVFSVLLTLSLVAGFVTPRLDLARESPSEAPSTVFESPADVEGRGLFSAIGCVGCLGGGAVIASSGLTATLAAAATKGSAIAVVTCVALCRDAIGSAW